MPLSCKFSVTASRKPTNTFYVWYVELCRRSNLSPLSVVKPVKTKNNTVLDFIADRIKPEEWTPILNSLRLDTSLHVVAIRSRVAGCKFFYEVNTEDRLRRMKRRYGCLWTDYVLKSLLRSLACCLSNTEVLSSLELDGLPINGEYLDLLLQSLRNNRTLKMVSLTHCAIGDRGCQQLCSGLRVMPNIEVLNLSSCNLSCVSGSYIATVIKHQQLNRYCESWHQSLRYEEPMVGKMAGLKRITLNNNPDLGDEGLTYILEELDDDLWIKALDMQKCGISENMSHRILDVVEYSRSLEVADFRNNELLSYATIERILQVLQKKRQIGNDPEYQWCVTTSTLCDFGASQSNVTGVAVVQKSRSAPLGQIEPLRNGEKPPLRRINTIAMIDKKSKYDNFKQTDRKLLNEAKKQFSTAINAKLHADISKRRESGKTNSTMEQFERFMQFENMSSERFEITDKLCRAMGDLRFDGNRGLSLGVKGLNGTRDIKSGLYKYSTTNTHQTVKKVTNDRPLTTKPSGKQKTPAKVVFSPIKKVSTEETPIAQKIFQEFLFKDSQGQDDVEYQEVFNENNYFSYYDDSASEEDFRKISKNQLAIVKRNQTPAKVQNNRTELFLREVVDEDLQLCLETNRSSNEISPLSIVLGSAQEKAQNFFNKILLEAG